LLYHLTEMIRHALALSSLLLLAPAGCRDMQPEAGHPDGGAPAQDAAASSPDAAGTPQDAAPNTDADIGDAGPMDGGIVDGGPDDGGVPDAGPPDGSIAE
jgi:hypothetical protein